jgi:MFS family permease
VLQRSGSEYTSVPLKTVLQFLWHRKRVYLSLFTGSSMLAMAGYGSAAWYPEFLYRNYGLSKSEGGSIYGTIYLVAGTAGVLIGPWLAELLRRRGYTDAYVRIIAFTAACATVPAVAAPLAGSPTPTFVLLVPAVFLGATYLGVMAASFPPITPNQMRGQTTALYIFITNILGMAVGTSVLAAFTDFVFKDDNALHLSLASINAIFYPCAVLLFWYCLPAYRESVEEAGNWKI